jgi:hypothetical protein
MGCAVGGLSAPGSGLRSAADGLRVLEECFDRYAAIAERSDDETLIAEAQNLAGNIVARLAIAGGARSNSLLDTGGKVTNS